MNDAKIRLSPEQMRLVTSAEWILTKNAIIQKVMDLFGSLAEEMQHLIHMADLPQEAKQTNAKISKGENYQGLPYVMLDYPRLFTKESVFAIRTFFWWAHYFSITLHLKGQHKVEICNRIASHIPRLSQRDFYLCTSSDEWQHDLSQENYLRMDQVNEQEFLRLTQSSEFLKITAKVSLLPWDQAPDLLLVRLAEILRALEI
jgi:hypothetical protein